MSSGSSGVELGALRDERAETWSLYEERGLGHRYGFGDRTALVVIDMANAFNDPNHPIGANQDSTVEAIADLLKVARATDMRRYFFTTAFHPDLHDAGGWIRKVPVIGSLQLGTPDVDIDPRLAIEKGEPLVVKKASSCFFGTGFDTWLRSEGIDTLVVTGCSTSGCVRATCLDASSHGFRVIVPAECVSDRREDVHRANLFDIDAKYADVMPLADVCVALEIEAAR
jgi:nicotinamidase-related amidase